jgi:hypothetical protein
MFTDYNSGSVYYTIGTRKENNSFTFSSETHIHNMYQGITIKRLNDYQFIGIYGTTANKYYLSGKVYTYDETTDTISAGPTTVLNETASSGNGSKDFVILPNNKLLIIHPYRGTNNGLACTIAQINEDLSMTVLSHTPLFDYSYYSSPDVLSINQLDNGKFYVFTRYYKYYYHSLISLNEDNTIIYKTEEVTNNYTIRSYDTYAPTKPIYLGDNKLLVLIDREPSYTSTGGTQHYLFYLISIEDNNIIITNIGRDDIHHLKYLKDVIMLDDKTIRYIGSNKYQTGDLICYDVKVVSNATVLILSYSTIKKGAGGGTPKIIRLQDGCSLIQSTISTNGLLGYGSVVTCTIDTGVYKAIKYDSYQSESFIEQKYSNNLVNGIATTDGTVGQTIEVYLPKEV